MYWVELPNHIKVYVLMYRVSSHKHLRHNIYHSSTTRHLYFNRIASPSAICSYHKLIYHFLFQASKGTFLSSSETTSWITLIQTILVLFITSVPVPSCSQLHVPCQSENLRLSLLTQFRCRHALKWYLSFSIHLAFTYHCQRLHLVTVVVKLKWNEIKWKERQKWERALL